MKFFKRIFASKEKTIESIKDFWDWFVINEETFYQVVKNHKDIEKKFLDKLSPKLDQLRDGIFYLTGMKNEE